MKLTKIIMAGALLLFVTFCFLLTYGVMNFIIDRNARAKSRVMAIEAHNQLVLGMTPDQVKPFVQGAWRSYQCDPGEQFPYLEVYLFGSRDTDLAGVLRLSFDRKEDGTLALANIAAPESFVLVSHLDSDSSCQIHER